MIDAARATSELVEIASQGDENARRELLERYRDHLRRIVPSQSIDYGHDPNTIHRPGRQEARTGPTLRALPVFELGDRRDARAGGVAGVPGHREHRFRGRGPRHVFAQLSRAT
jgi:hypothetical protein